VRLAWLSPLPPTPSGIADYSFELLRLVAEKADVDVVCPRRSWGRRPRVPHGTRFVTPEGFRKRADGYDAVFHHLGNNPHHAFVYELAQEHPGIAVFHELVLHHMIDHLLMEGLPQIARYERVMEAEYGQVGLRLAELRSRWVSTDFEKFLFPLAGEVARRARAIVVHNQDARERMEEVAPGVPVFVIPHHAGSPPPEVEGVTRAEARRTLGLPADAFIVGHFGYITKPKHPAAVIGGFARLVERFPDSLLVLTGADHSGGGLQYLVTKHGLGDRVRTAGFVDLHRFYLYLKAVDAVVSLRYPSAGESSGTLTRAIAEGRPVIVNDLGSFAELPDDVALKVEVDEDWTEAVGRHLVKLAEDPALRSRMQEAARRFAARELSPARCRDLYLEAARAFA
jgi:glycosyltransferase involved in cell wall biosynthesis